MVAKCNIDIVFTFVPLCRFIRSLVGVKKGTYFNIVPPGVPAKSSNKRQGKRKRTPRIEPTDQEINESMNLINSACVSVK